jgi:DTW domain-containing protein YfiP
MGFHSSKPKQCQYRLLALKTCINKLISDSTAKLAVLLLVILMRFKKYCNFVCFIQKSSDKAFEWQLPIAESKYIYSSGHAHGLQNK